MSQVISWFGSKSKFVNRIVEKFPQHDTFVDVFGGSGVVLLNKPQSKIEVYNDIDSRLVNLFKILQNTDSRKEFVDRISYVPYSRQFYMECRAKLMEQADELDEMELAVCFFVLSRQSFAGLADYSSSWSYSKTAASASTNKFQRGIRSIEAFAHRFKYVQIENLGFEDILIRYDNEQTLFYLDPPYIISSRNRACKRYQHEMSDEDHTRMVEMLLHLTGKAIVSGYDNEIYLKLEQSGWQKESFIIRTNASKSKNKNNLDTNIRQECLWVSPNAVTSNKSKLISGELTNKQIAAISVAHKRAKLTEANIRQAIRELRLRKKRVTKTAVAEMIGMSRVHITRNYGNLFK